MNSASAYCIIIFLGMVLGYLCGSIMFSRIVANKKHVDITQVGSCNSGASNVARVLGKKLGILVLFLDMLKTIIPIIIVWMVAEFGLYQYMPANSFNYKNTVYLTGLFVVLGHVFPVYYKFKGGKGIACSIAIYFMLSPFLGLISLLIVFISLAITKISSIGSLLMTVIMPFLVLIVGLNYLYILNTDINYFKIDTLNYFLNSLFPFVMMLLISGLVLYKHKDNIKNLLEKKENKII